MTRFAATAWLAVQLSAGCDKADGPDDQLKPPRSEGEMQDIRVLTPAPIAKRVPLSLDEMGVSWMLSLAATLPRAEAVDIWVLLLHRAQQPGLEPKSRAVILTNLADTYDRWSKETDSVQDIIVVRATLDRFHRIVSDGRSDFGMSPSITDEEIGRRLSDLGVDPSAKFAISRFPTLFEVGASVEVDGQKAGVVPCIIGIPIDSRPHEIVVRGKDTWTTTWTPTDGESLEPWFR
jgi:hypothetical protein